MSQVTDSTKDRVALPEITVDSIVDAVSQEMTQQGNKTLASFWAKNQDKYQDFVREMATVAIEEAARQLGAQARKDRIWYRVGFNTKRFPLLVQWFSFMDKLYPRGEGTDKLENWYMAGWQEVEKSGAASGKAEVIIITKNKEVFTPDKVAFLGTVATRGDKNVSLYQVTGFPVFVDRDPKSKNYTRVFTYTSKVEEIIAPNARFVSWEDGRARGAAAYTEGVKNPFYDPVLREAYSGKEPLPSFLYLDGWKIGESEAFSKAFFAKSNPSLRNQQQKRHKATGHKRHSPLSTQVTADTGLEEDRPSSTGSPWPGATHFEARFAERTGFGSGEAPAVRAEKIRRISQQIVQILNDTAPATISLTAHGGTLRTLVPIPGWGCAFVWAYKHRLILRSWWPAGCEVGVESAWPAEASTRIAAMLSANWVNSPKAADAVERKS